MKTHDLVEALSTSGVTYRHAARDFRLTDVHCVVHREILP